MGSVIPIKEKLKFSDLFDNHTVKQIVWGEAFNQWPLEKQVDYAKKLASAMNQAADEMQGDRDKCYHAMVLAQAQRDEAQQASAISKSTMVNTVLATNEKVRKLEAEILLLNQRLKAYE